MNGWMDGKKKEKFGAMNRLEKEKEKEGKLQRVVESAKHE